MENNINNNDPIEKRIIDGNINVDTSKIFINTSTNFEFKSDGKGFLVKCHRGVKDAYAFNSLGRNFGGGNVWKITVYRKVNKKYVKNGYFERNTKKEIIQELSDGNFCGLKCKFNQVLYELKNGKEAVNNLKNEAIKHGIYMAKKIIYRPGAYYKNTQTDIERIFDGYYDNTLFTGEAVDIFHKISVDAMKLYAKLLTQQQ